MEAGFPVERPMGAPASFEEAWIVGSINALTLVVGFILS